jgi:hypothetical protein
VTVRYSGDKWGVRFWKGQTRVREYAAVLLTIFRTDSFIKPFIELYRAVLNESTNMIGSLEGLYEWERGENRLPGHFTCISATNKQISILQTRPLCGQRCRKYIFEKNLTLFGGWSKITAFVSFELPRYLSISSVKSKAKVTNFIYYDWLIHPKLALYRRSDGQLSWNE